MKITMGLFAVLLTVSVHGQRKAYTQYQYWVRYQNRWSISPKTEWINDVENRRFAFPDTENAIAVTSRITHTIKTRWEIQGGFAGFWYYAQFPENPYPHKRTELRPLTSISYTLPFKKFSLQNRLWLDFRFLQNDDAASIWDGSRFTTRFRHRVQLAMPLRKNQSGEPTVNGAISNELMLNHNGNTFDQDRIYSSIDFNIVRHVGVEFAYMYTYQHRWMREEYFKRHALRFTLIHRI